MTDVYAYEATGIGSDLFGVIDLNTGVFTALGSMGLTLGGLGSYGGVIYGGEYHGNTLYSVNTSTGALTAIGTGNISYGGFGSTTSGLYSIGWDSNLYSIDPTTGAATELGPTGISLTGVIGMSAGSSTLYVTQNDSLYALNTTNGSATLLGTAVNAEIGFGAEVSIGGVLYAGAYGSSTPNVYTLDTQTGASTFLAASPSTPSSPGVAGFWGLAPIEPDIWKTGTAGDWSTAADWQSGVVPTSTDDTVINNSNAVTVNGTAVANLLMLNSSTLTESGTLTLGTLIFDGYSTLALSGGTLSAQSITTDNVAYEAVLSGYGTVSGAVSGTFYVQAIGGTLKVEGSVAAVCDIYPGATLELSDGTHGPIYFPGTAGTATLKLDAPTAYTFWIIDIVAGDKIDLAGITANSASYDGSTLTINETNGQQLTYNVSGTHLVGDTVAFASDNNGGTLVYWTQDQTAPTVAITSQALLHDTGISSTDRITNDGHVTLTGSVSDNNAVARVEIFDGMTDLGAAMISGGTWNFAYNLAVGTHALEAFATDVAGNQTMTAAQPTIIVDQTAPVPVIASEALSKSGAVTLTGTTAEANDTIAVYDGTTLLGTTTTASNGTWSFTTGKASNAVHTYTATATDVAGNVGQSSNEAILGSSKADTLVGTSGKDIINGNGGNDTITGGLGADTLTGGSGKVTFAYNAILDSTPGSHDMITDFTHGQDKIDFTNIAGINASGGVPTFQGQLTGSVNLTLNAHSVAYIEVSGNTMVLVNTTNSAETVTSANVAAANMEIVLVGINLHLTSTDFHHV